MLMWVSQPTRSSSACTRVPLVSAIRGMPRPVNCRNKPVSRLDCINGSPPVTLTE